MAIQGKIARRYAKALFDELKGQDIGHSIVEELGRFSAVVTEHKELALVLSSPVFAESKKTAVVTDVARKMHLSDNATQILLAISKLGRLTFLAAIIERLRVNLLEGEGIQAIQVWTSEAVSAEEKKQIEDRFTKVLGKQVQATYGSKPALVGGLRVVAGGRTFDGTVAGWLDTLRETMVEGEA